jgi:hypothetical protein
MDALAQQDPVALRERVQIGVAELVGVLVDDFLAGP